ncbi:Por secretion system C-terminal sorting domain-containing protein [Lishizhenia tianjinensis]|uniref:Por secretion system C-terminal sorting domain-containing protein n=1 Tax=Lishizhenia tianjinensis TaxID=477690 RepID=A0A1I7AWK1_9FLAO|nr:T9SS type A sorting domain-containing protein [Lishizhenia tianjinensis]SFT79299.1 Por secretion system C-terminal sorting domain-containing protein [Lishizhenia tianjinensis]
MRKQLLTLSAAVLAALGVEAQCSPITAPFIESFTSNSVPTCWTKSQTSGSGWTFNGNPGYDVSGTADHTGGVTGSDFAWIDFSGGTFSPDIGCLLESPEIDVTGMGQPALRFWHISTCTNPSNLNNLGNFNELYIEAFDGTSWVTVGSEIGENGGAWTEFLYDLSPYVYNTNLIKFRFRGEYNGNGNAFYNDLLLDDVEIFDGSTFCFAPTNGQVLGATGSSVTLSWEGSGSNYIIEYGAPGFTPGTGTFSNVTVTGSSPFQQAVTGLTAGNIYDFYIYQDCQSLLDTSTAIGPLTETAQCSPVTDFYVTSGSTSMANVEWVSSGANFIVEYGTTGFNPGSGTSNSVTSSTNQDITGLASNSFYDAYVRVICGPGDTSIYYGPVTFNTYGLGAFMDWDNSCPSLGYVEMDTVAGAQFQTIGDLQEFGLTLPFPFLWQNQLMTDITIADEGVAVLGTQSAQVTFSNSALSPSSYIGFFPHWDDMHTGDIYYGVVGSAPNRVFIVEWDDRPHFVQVAGQTVDFQIQLHEADQSVYFVYNDVVFGGTQAGFDYGASATIGVNGPEQTIQVSYNNPDYLTNNSCIHFFYTDCPNVDGLTVTTYDYNQIGLDWNPGLAQETEWIVEWGTPGFTPGGAGSLGTQSSMVSSDTITGLTQLTDYDVYVYANCDPTAPLTSSGMLVQHQTAPECANPFGIGSGAAPDSIFASWNWQPNASGQLPVSYNITYVPSGQEVYGSTATEYNTGAAIFADTIVDQNLIASGVYDMYVQTVCASGDTSLYVGPVNFLAFLDNDSSCYAQELQVNGNAYILYNNGAQNDPGIAAIEPPTDGFYSTQGWGQSPIYRSTWYTFTAPASGDVMISGTDVNYFAKMAVYETTNCGDYSQYNLIGANDNGVLFGATNAPEWAVCGLTPGQTYYLLHSAQYSYTGAGTYSIKLEELDFNAGSATGIVDACIGDTVDLFNSITGYDVQYGTWIDLANTSQLVTDNDFATTVLASQVYNFEYRVELGCSYDSIVGQVEIYPPSSAGQDGSINVCKNEPINLFTGLSGNVDLGGTWYDPQDAVVNSNIPASGTVPGQFNYDYIAGNGVCPDDTALVVVIVDAGCDWLGLSEEMIEGISVYPNPTSGILNITSAGQHDDLAIQMVDVNGRVVYVGSEELASGSNVKIDISNLTTGVYMLNLTNGTSINTYRVIVE